MNFASWSFVGLFLPGVIAVFWLISGPRAAHYRQAWIIAVSLVFYGVSGFANLGLFLGSILFNYLAGAWIARQDNRRSRWWGLWVAVATNIGILFLFKGRAAWISTADGFHAGSDILVPLAISFITFQQISFITGCYRRVIARPDFFNYLFFIAMFPHLVMGPILRYEHIDGQLRDGALERRSTENLVIGLAIFLFGLAKKVLLADPLGAPVDDIFAFARTDAIGTGHAWFGAVAFQFQIFLDFSAYADMAIGLGRMININLPINFDRPFHALDRFDLWRRWHITFVVFMRGHVFMPLVRHAHFPVPLALAATGVLSGLWHGLGWTFVVWGIVQTITLLAAHYRAKIRRDRGMRREGFRRVRAIVITFLIGCVLGVLFRSPDLQTAGTIYSALLQPSWGGPVMDLRPADWLHFGLAAAFIWIVPDAMRLFEHYWTADDPRPWATPRGQRSGAMRFTLTPGWAIVCGVVLSLSLLYLADAGRFIYVQF